MPPQQIQRSKLRFSALCIYFQRWIPHMHSKEFHANICTIYWCCWDYLENKNNENLVTRIIGAWSKRRTHLVDKFAFDGRVNHQIAQSDHWWPVVTSDHCEQKNCRFYTFGENLIFDFALNIPLVRPWQQKPRYPLTNCVGKLRYVANQLYFTFMVHIQRDEPYKQRVVCSVFSVHNYIRVMLKEEVL